MKKYLILFALLFIVTGCVNMNDVSYDEVLDNSLSLDTLKANTYLEGYKMYLPQDMTMIGDLNGNVVLYSHSDKYYLYVDLVSFYNKKENNYSFEMSNYEYSQKIDDDFNGYVLVSKSLGGYLVEVMYNYAKIEVITNDVSRAIINSVVVLKSIDYNYKIIDSMIGSNTLVYDSELFSLLGPKKDSDKFLQYVEEYGAYDEKEDSFDEDIIDMKTD